MDYTERLEDLESVFAHLIDPKTRERIASTHDVPVEMNYTVADALTQARLAGYDCIDERVYKPSMREQYEMLKRKGFSLADIGAATTGNLGPSSVGDAVNGRSTKNTDAVQQGIDALIAQTTTLRKVS